MDNIFFLTLFFIFMTALVSTYVARRSGDRCLKDMEGFHVTVELKDKRTMWGKLAVFSNGLELLYKLPQQDARGHRETSAILLGDQLGNIQVIYRYHDELSEENKKERELEILRTYHPGLHRQLARALRSFLNTFRDALNESIGFIISSVKAKSSSAVVQTQDQRLAKIGKTVLGAATNAYEPVLERYIGRRVVAEEVHGEAERTEHPGILKEYTARWIEILDCRLTQEHTFDLSQPERLQLNHDLDFVIHKQPGEKPVFAISIENYGTETVQVKCLKARDDIHLVNLPLPPGETMTIDPPDLPETIFEGLDLERIPAEVALRAAQRPGKATGPPDEIPPLPPLQLVFEAVRAGDLCLPRQHAFVRHGVESPGQGWIKDAWQDFAPWIRSHPWRSSGRGLWLLFNALLSGLAGWGVTAGLANGQWGLNLTMGIIVGLLYGGTWLIEWSILIQGEIEFARKLRRRLSLVTFILIFGVGLYILI